MERMVEALLRLTPKKARELVRRAKGETAMVPQRNLVDATVARELSNRYRNMIEIMKSGLAKIRGEKDTRRAHRIAAATIAKADACENMCAACWESHGQHGKPCDNDCGCHEVITIPERRKS